jgi:hypothetical protein
MEKWMREGNQALNNIYSILTGSSSPVAVISDGEIILGETYLQSKGYESPINDLSVFKRFCSDLAQDEFAKNAVS